MRELNADAVYTGMVWMREFCDEEGDVEHIERLAAKAKLEESFNGDAINFVYLEEFLDWIYAGEPDSVETGLEMARCIMFGPSGCIDKVYPNKCKAMKKALRRFTDNKFPRVPGLKALEYGTTMH